jgi:hypothetical protein
MGARWAAQALPAAEVERLASVCTEVRLAPLTFYSTFKLVWMRLEARHGARGDLFMLAGEGRTLILDGSAAPIHEANQIERLSLSEVTVGDYARFFCYFVWVDAGPFPIMEQVSAAKDVDEEKHQQRDLIARHVRPLEVVSQGPRAPFRVTCTILFGDTLFRTVLAVSPDGTTVMQEDEELVAGVAEELRPAIPALYPACLMALFASWAPIAGPPQAAAPRPIIEVLVELLLERALVAQSGHRLIARFNSTAGNQPAVGQFSMLLGTASPVVAIESAIPFVEEVIARILLRSGPGAAWAAVVTGTSDPADDTRLKVNVPANGPAVVLVSMHAYRGIVDVLRVAHELGSRDVAALIGCERLADVPTSLREIVDLTLRLPAMTPDLFETLCQRVMGQSLPPGWRQPHALWVGSILPTDLEHPLAFKLSPEETVRFVHDRVLERLRAVDPAEGLSLSNLHGLGEARQFAEDLIAGIRAATANQLEWSEVDRGVLLAGPPGTGKTTLARAIAKDCGIKFITASAASWQSAGHLGDHIRAIRADFAQARRFAPSILFIDEIDSIGNRELMSGQNMQYQTEVVNAVLEQMQGLDPSAPVIVIGATNNPGRVDPALRRAGRLDRMIEIPHPSSDALAAIFRHYLKPLSARGGVAADVDPDVLGRMCLRRTGADVELFVRGARRRARKAGRPLNQGDLVAEITGKPRDPSAIPPMSPEEIERVALHEAGHAVARFLSSTNGTDIAFVSIVPRFDGTLGFVAFAPSEKQFVTRAEYVESIEITLAGRAAEEIRYGKDGISGGAHDDLRQATRTAHHMISQLGLGPGDSLAWSDAPSTEQLAEADRLLAAAYRAVIEKLRRNETLVVALADALEKRQEMTGAEVLAVLR